MALTGRKQAFADALLGGATKTEAAKAAGLSEKTAAQAGSRLAKDKDVIAYLAKNKGKGARGRGYTMPDGRKAPDAPADWPFGTVDPNPAPAPPPAAAPAQAGKRKTAREYLSDLVNDLEADEKLRLDAAKKLIEFEEAKPAPMGKKAAKLDEAKKVAGSRFAAAAPPRLAASGGKRVP